MHWLLNFLVKGGSEDGFVLLRALEPTKGIEDMRRRRGMDGLKNLCSGPGKLTRAFGIDGGFHGRDLFEAENSPLVTPTEPPRILEGPRIGISRATDLPWRFVAAGSHFLSAPMKKR
jgi:DNA-3-methyladenine glycosylase